MDCICDRNRRLTSLLHFFTAKFLEGGKPLTPGARSLSPETPKVFIFKRCSTSPSWTSRVTWCPECGEGRRTAGFLVRNPNSPSNEETRLWRDRQCPVRSAGRITSPLLWISGIRRRESTYWRSGSSPTKTCAGTFPCDLGCTSSDCAAATRGRRRGRR